MRFGRPDAASIPAALAALLCLALCTAASAAEPTISPEEIRPGMKGYGLTVFEGTEPQRFDVEVVAVVPNFILRQSMILVRADHPITDRAGIIGGMSGSPIYVDGRLAGALAYGWRFSKEPIAGVIPIRAMLDVIERDDLASGADAGRRNDRPRLSRFRSPLGDASARSGAERYFRRFGSPGEERIAPARTPLALSGFVGEARRLLSEALAPFDIDPVQGGGAGGEEGPTRFEPGSAIGVQLIRGDLSATGIGTVTAVRDDRVLAFGHPMFNMGSGLLPVSTARIHTVIPSLNRSNKIGSPLTECGALVQDRIFGVLARTDRRAPTIPVVFVLRDERGRRLDEYEVEMLSHDLLTPRFLRAVLVSAIRDMASDMADVTAELEARIELSGRPPVVLHDSGTSRAGLLSLAGYFRPTSLIGEILRNPFEEARLESLSFDVELSYGRRVAEVVGAYLTSEEPLPGDVINVHVRLRHYGGEEQLTVVPVRMPESAANRKIKITVGGGDYVLPVIPEPQSLDDMLANASRYHPPQSLVVGIDIPGEGIELRGRVLERLPASAVSALHPTAGFEQIDIHHTAVREIVPLDFLVAGEDSIQVEVGSRRER